MVTHEAVSEELPVVVGFDGFYLANRDRLYRALVLTIRNRDLAVEAIDEAMVRAYERWSTVGAYDSPEGWGYRVALNWSRSVLRRKRPQVAESEAVWDSPPDLDVARAVGSLSVKLRSVVVARYYRDWSVPQIAERLDSPPGTVKSRLHRALERVETSLGGN